ncbi:hypothetical protein LCGC14_2285340, partial [marine sediment metagenome]
TLTVTENGVVLDAKSSPPADGTDAADVFNGYVDFSGGTNTSLEIADAADYTHTFSGLDTGADFTYNFTGTSIRGNAGYTDRWTLVTLVGAEASVLVEFEGDGVWVESPTAVAINAGANHLAGQGFVASWTGIDPGVDGQFSVVSTYYTGEIPGGMASSTKKSYALTGIRFEAVPIGGKGLGESAESEAEDFQWLYEFEQINANSGPSKKTKPVEAAVDQLMATEWA